MLSPICVWILILMLTQIGGLDLKVQEKVLRGNPDVVIATPGRLIDHLRNTPSFRSPVY